MWPYDIDNYNPNAWNKPDPTVENLKKRDDHMMEQIRVLTGQVEDLKKRQFITEEAVTTMTLFNLVYQFYFEEVITKDETKRLITMLNSPDDQDKSLARDMILQKIK